jgi:intein/homing endonuclease
MFPFFPSFKVRFCLAPTTDILTPNGWEKAESVKVGDKVLTVDSRHIDLSALLETKQSSFLSEEVALIEAEIVSVEARSAVLIGFNDLGKDYSVTQPILVKESEGISYKNAEDVEIGDVLLGVASDGAVSETVVVSIEKDEAESTVYEVKTSPQPWFITRSFIVIA